MEMKLSNELICINEVIFDGALEQSVELDYLLPDYCECIFKILKCKIVPKITSERISNDKLIIDGCYDIKIFYVGEEGYHIRCITQKQSFCKSVELNKNAENGIATVYAKCNYVNCRAVNRRRIDIRGAIGIKATVTIEKNVDVISSAEGMGLQCCGKKITALDKKLCGYKDFTVEEELELSYGKPEIGEILDYRAFVRVTDCKVIANKVVAKGEASLHILYSSAESKTPEIMENTVAVSQLIDVPGITDDYNCFINFDIIDAMFTIIPDDDNGTKGINASLFFKVKCEANRNSESELIGDIYSTLYDIDTSAQGVKIEQLVRSVNESHICKITLPVMQNEVSCVYDISCEYIYESCKIENGSVYIVGNLLASALALDSDSMPIMLEKNTPCEIKLEAFVEPDGGSVTFSPYIAIESVSYNITAEREVEVRAEVAVCGCVFKNGEYKLIKEINIDETRKKEKDTSISLRLYFASENEDIWEIAKRYGTSMEAIMAENSLDERVVKEKCMLLVPIIS